ncbi:hypothetical protein AQUSIP_22000 [Aquicella siphonis]|uniref:Uncharacterized protein n=1 Tax=Aquicella siphonis TaxID=254247 RepID=A0A5E4PKL6_9COXI|nr:hypothetical protein [Aquicella siphonis]VVC76873.1 hypothetical protein AQUSIP_22000 [Aquicella siphonis]
MQRLVNQIVPFILAGVAIVAFAFGIMLLAYLFLFGALVGFILFLIAWIRSRFFAPKTVSRPRKTSGRIIDSDDWKEL